MSGEPANKPSSRTPLAVPRGLFAAMVAVFAVASLSGLGETLLHPAGTHLVTGALLGVGGALCILRAIGVSGQRVAWIATGGGLASWAVGEVMFGLTPELATGPLSTANVLSLAFYPAACPVAAHQSEKESVTATSENARTAVARTRPGRQPVIAIANSPDATSSRSASG